MTDVIQWILLKKRIVNSLHYLGDFILVAKRKEDANDPVSSTLLRVRSLIRAIKTGRAVTKFNILRHRNGLSFSCQLQLPREKISQIKRNAIILHSKMIPDKKASKPCGASPICHKSYLPGQTILAKTVCYAANRQLPIPSHSPECSSKSGYVVVGPLCGQMEWDLNFMRPSKTSNGKLVGIY